MKKFTIAAAAVALSLAMAAPSQAQTGMGFNLQYGTDFEEFQGGIEFLVPFQAVSGLSFVPNAELYLTDDPTVFSLNADFHYAFGRYTQSVTPYVGAGLAVTRMAFEELDDRTEVGVNLIGGINLRTSSAATPFFQVEYRTSDFEDLSFGGGVRFRI